MLPKFTISFVTRCDQLVAYNSFGKICVLRWLHLRKLCARETERTVCKACVFDVFESHCAWQVRYLMNLKGMKIVFCETVVECALKHDDDFVWHAGDFGCLEFVLRCGRGTL
jgi:hypothetical protein